MSDFEIVGLILVLSTVILGGVSVGLRYFNGWSKREVQKAQAFRDRAKGSDGDGTP